ncbi:MAG: nucleotidyltransferase family protein [Mangrovibacterium sp.]|nr:nucleotidyltransferase family protein [Mangrovibacterium sp.]
MMEAIVLAGGLGSRLRSVVSGIPKPMAPVSDKPFLYYILKWLESNQVSRIILSVGYRWEMIYDTFGERFHDRELIYSVEDAPLGTGGAIALAMEKLTGDCFFIVNGDTLFKSDLSRLFVFHRRGAFDLSMLLKPMNDFDRYGTVELNDEHRITRFHEKKPQKTGLINGGIYLAGKQIQAHFPPAQAFSFEKEFLETKQDELSFGGLVSNDYFIDIGIPSDYMKARNELDHYI